MTVLQAIADHRMSSAPCPCKICGAATVVAFALPLSKKTGHPIPDAPNDCPYFECTECGFCFSTHLDEADHTQVYDEAYWTEDDPDWTGKVGQTLRLVMVANAMIGKHPAELEILDYGCGMGGFVQHAREHLNMKVWGTDIVMPKLGRDWFLPRVSRQFDVICACEVIEHLPDPMSAFREIRGWLKPGGCFAYQTAEYDPHGERRDWWYVGPDNGHISLYSRSAFDHAFDALGGADRLLWNNYPGLQAWRFN